MQSASVLTLCLRAVPYTSMVRGKSSEATLYVLVSVSARIQGPGTEESQLRKSSYLPIISTHKHCKA